MDVAGSTRGRIHVLSRSKEHRAIRDRGRVLGKHRLPRLDGRRPRPSQTVGPGGVFRRGETNEDGTLDLSDGVRVLNYLFTGTATLSCLKAGDANDSGVLDLSDGVYLLSYLFLGGPAPPAPFPACGTDPTEDELGCASYESCP